jgi:hypothetical protein
VEERQRQRDHNLHELAITSKRRALNSVAPRRNHNEQTLQNGNDNRRRAATEHNHRQRTNPPVDVNAIRLFYQ